MNKQRKVVITTTYNEMGIIIDTKAEEVAQPDLQPTCNELATDTISRQAGKLKVARVIWEDGDSCYDFHDKCVDCLDDVPPAQPEPKWIPVSERLPEENMWTICQNNAGAMMIGKYNIEFGWMFPAYFDGIVAWMPLPEPYREEGAQE